MKHLKIIEVKENKKECLDLLLLADEQEDMIDRYLSKGTMYLVEDHGVKAECVVLDAGNHTLEIKNIAVAPSFHRKGYGKALINFLVKQYHGKYNALLVGTGESPLTIPFYERCGFNRSHRIPDFFRKNYDHPIFECGVQLTDMIYLRREI